MLLFSYVTRIMGLSAKKNTRYQMKLSGVIDIFTHEVQRELLSYFQRQYDS